MKLAGYHCRMRRLLPAAVLLAGCYAPAANTGAPCGPGGSCPEGQECRGAVCFSIGAPHDSATSIPDDARIDSALVDASIDGPSYVPWSTPTELTSLESTANGETDPTITADKLTVVFAAENTSNNYDLFIATRTALTDTFVITPLTALNSPTADDKSPELSPDGTTLYFVSARSGNFDVYVSTFTTSWSSPVLRDDLSTAGEESDLAISPDGLTAAVFDAGGTDELIFYTRATTAADFGNAVAHPEINVGADVAAPSITNNADIVYFHAGATRQLYRATKQTNGTYSTPIAVSDLNIPNVRCAAPFVLQTDDFMIFDRASDIYFATR